MIGATANGMYSVLFWFQVNGHNLTKPRSHGPKAPRSHYDHVTHKLVLNMDHYCPWMQKENLCPIKEHMPQFSLGLTVSVS